MLSLLRYYFDLFIDFVFGLFYKSKVKRVSAPANKLVIESAVTIAKKIRNRELTSEEVVTAFIDRITEVNPLINAVVDQRFDEALAEARNLDENISLGNITQEDFNKRPFLGVPFTVKEAISGKGLSHTLGLVSRKNHKALTDAEVVQKLKNAGAILLGVTNLPVLSAWSETTNPVYGTTHNPYNTTRNVGGSSGGEACIIAACGSPFGVATDLGGSTRIPAFTCGVFGHKTSSHLVSLKGIMFNEAGREDGMASVGPVTRHAEDIAPILKVIIGENSNRLKLDANVDVRDIRIHYVVNPGDPVVSPFRDEVNKVMMKCVQYFTAFSHKEPSALDVKELKHGGKIWFYLIDKVPDKSFTKDLTNRQGEVGRIRELCKYFMGRSDFNIYVILVLLTHFLPRQKSEWVKEIIDILKDKLLSALGTNGVLLYPSAPLPASYHYTSVFRPYNINLFSVWNALEFCVTQVPMGLSKEGVPLGIQVVAPPFQDHLTIAVAKELERAFGGYVPPFESQE